MYGSSNPRPIWGLYCIPKSIVNLSFPSVYSAYIIQSTDLGTEVVHSLIKDTGSISKIEGGNLNI